MSGSGYASDFAGLSSAARRAQRSAEPLAEPIASATRKSLERRLKRFIVDADSEPLRLFHPRFRQHSRAGDWYGEHAGKWLRAASLAAIRTQDETLLDRVGSVVAYLAEQQEPSGYLGTYAEDAPCRFTSGLGGRTWDLWVHAWLIKGLLAAEGAGVEGALPVAERIADLLLETFGSGSCSLLDQGNHAGLSSAVLIEPLAELAVTAGRSDIADLARGAVEAMEERGIWILSGPERGTDVAELGTGKSYQICWVLAGLVALYRWGGKGEMLRAASYYWRSIRDDHLTPLGGPWGGIATHKEVFNAKGFFSPYGLVETCSAQSWMALSRELYLETGEGQYLQEAQKTLVNTILGAQDENGEDWCYFTFPNGRRNNTYHWACCKSSGALALEEAALIPTASRAPDAVQVIPHTYTLDHHGQEIVRTDYACVARGPYVYATALLDGFRKEETLRLPRLNPESVFHEAGEEKLELRLPGREPILFEPYYKAGGRHDGAWRSTWLQVAWQ